MTKLVYHVAGATQEKRKDGAYYYGRLIYDKLAFYDIETDTRHIDDELPDLDELDESERDAALESFVKHSALNVRNLLQVCVLIPKTAKGLDLKLADRYDEIELNGVEFYRLFFGFIKVAKRDIPAHAQAVAARLFVFRSKLKSHKTFVGFNNSRFDGGIFPKLLGETDVCESLTHKLSIGKMAEFDLINWARAVGCGSLGKLGDVLAKEGYDSKKYKELLTTQSQELMDKYNSRDCEILAHFVHLLNSLGIHHHNMPSLVRWILGNVFLDAGINKIFSPDYFQTIEGVGGRTEAYKADLAGSYVYDANSLYPTVQSLLPFPAFTKKRDGAASVELRKVSLTSIEARTFKKKVELLYSKAGEEVITSEAYQTAYREIFKDKQYWLRVVIKDIHPDFLHIFPFGYKDKDTGLVCFNLNQDIVYEVDSYMITWLALCEYEIKDMRVVRSEMLPFAEYIKETYEKRQEYKRQGSSLQMLQKIILNAGFGIWGSRGDRTRRDMTRKTREAFESTSTVAQEVFGVKPRSIIMYDQMMQSDVVVVKSGSALYSKAIAKPRFVAQSVPSISQTTLSHARAYMYSIMRMIIRGGGEIRYTDTDSVFIDEKGRDALEASGMVGDGIGKMGYEDQIVSGYAVAPKLYNYLNADGKYTCKSKGVKDPSKINTSNRTSLVDDLKIVQKIVAKAGGLTKRKVVGGVHENCVGSKDEAWSKVFRSFIDLHCRQTGTQPDHRVLKAFMSVDVEEPVETVIDE